MEIQRCGGGSKHSHPWTTVRRTGKDRPENVFIYDPDSLPSAINSLMTVRLSLAALGEFYDETNDLGMNISNIINMSQFTKLFPIY